MNGIGVELIGYLGSALVASSMLMVSIVRLRIINLAGSIAFCVYGAFLPSIPIMLTNGLIIAVNLVQLRKTWVEARKTCEYVLVDETRQQQLADYVAANQSEIARFAPHFSSAFLRLALDNAGQALMAFHALNIRGLAVWMPLTALRPADYPDYPGLRELMTQLSQGGKSRSGAFLIIDYIDGRYRDLGLGRKLGDALAPLSTPEIRQLYTVSPVRSPLAASYLRGQGFVPDGLAGNLVLWRKALPPPLAKPC